MSDVLIFHRGEGAKSDVAFVRVPTAALPTVVVNRTPPQVLPSVVANPKAGPKGDPGERGQVGPAGRDGIDGKDGQPRFEGAGPPPDLIVGSTPNDLYLDVLTGDLYRLS